VVRPYAHVIRPRATRRDAAGQLGLDEARQLPSPIGLSTRCCNAVVSEAHVARSVAPRRDTSRVASSGDEQVVVDELLPERSRWRNVS
jgi:hypothetical protein